mgnify:CR=1 FL=1
MDEKKAWTVYNTLSAVLAQLDQTTTPQLYANVAAAVSSAKDLLVQVLQTP